MITNFPPSATGGRAQTEGGVCKGLTSRGRRLLERLCDHLAAQRAPILLAWRKAAAADPDQTTVESLTPAQFNDHIPELLDAFERQLRFPSGSQIARDADRTQKEEGVRYGLHRWQQGYRLTELVHEWGHLYLCLLEELDRFAAAHPEFEGVARTEAQRQLITLVTDAVSESVAQYERMQQSEAGVQVKGLLVALANMREIEHRRAALIHQAVHDLSSNVFAVSAAAKVLNRAAMAEAERIEFTELLGRGLRSVTEMLSELTVLVRLEAGHERRQLAPFDAAALVAEVCAVNDPVAHERGLFLTRAGPPSLVIDGDAGRVRRLVQNLLVNALKYTERGGVTVSWGCETKRWWIKVQDSGPGLRAGGDTSIVTGLTEAAPRARPADDKADGDSGEASRVCPSPALPTAPSVPQPAPGEGIGLSIVKRLCELLDARLELSTSAEIGTTFRVLFPRSYANRPRPPVRPAKE